MTYLHHTDGLCLGDLQIVPKHPRVLTTLRTRHPAAFGSASFEGAGVPYHLRIKSHHLQNDDKTDFPGAVQVIQKMFSWPYVAG